MNTLIVNGLKAIFSVGIPLGFILEILHLDWIDLKQTKVEEYNEFFIFFTTPIFNLDKLSKKIDSAVEAIELTKDYNIPVEAVHAAQALV